MLIAREASAAGEEDKEEGEVFLAVVSKRWKVALMPPMAFIGLIKAIPIIIMEKI